MKMIIFYRYTFLSLLMMLLFTTCQSDNKTGIIMEVKTTQNVSLCPMGGVVKTSTYYRPPEFIYSSIGFASIPNLTDCLDLEPSELIEIGSTFYDYSNVNDPIWPLNFLSTEIITECEKAKSFDKPVYVILDVITEESGYLWPNVYELTVYGSDKTNTSYTAIQPMESNSGNPTIGFCTGIQGKYISLLFVLPESIESSMTKLSLKTPQGTINWEKDNAE